MSSDDFKRYLTKKKIILIRMGGELGIKSRQTRRRMKRNLRNDIKNLLIDYSSMQIKEFRDRFILYTDDKDEEFSLDEIVHLITDSISGVSSVSIARVVETNVETITSDCVLEAKKVLKSDSTFAVRVNREGKHEFSSLEIARTVGAAILNSDIKNLKVNLDNPDYQIFLDIRGPLAFIYSSSYQGMDGIPSLSQGKAISLIKPNFNSIFASWLMKKRGVKIIPIFFSTGKSSETDYLSYVKRFFDQDCIVLDLTERLKHFKDNISLCLLCQIYCEEICGKKSLEHGLSVIVSPTTFNFNSETISLEALKILEKRAILSVIRPIQLGYYGDTSKLNTFTNGSCCPNRSEVSYIFAEDFNEEVINKFFAF